MLGNSVFVRSFACLGSVISILETSAFASDLIHLFGVVVDLAVTLKSSAFPGSIAGLHSG